MVELSIRFLRSRPRFINELSFLYALGITHWIFAASDNVVPFFVQLILRFMYLLRCQIFQKSCNSVVLHLLIRVFFES